MDLKGRVRAQGGAAHLGRSLEMRHEIMGTRVYVLRLWHTREER
jgi:hypothetical protein